MQNEKGLTLLEVIMAILVISLTVTAMIKALDQDLKGQTQVRNRLRATNLALAKLNALKDYAHAAASVGSFDNLTTAPMVVAFSVTSPAQTALIDNRAFTWTVSNTYVSVTNPGATFNVSYTTKVMKFIAVVTWNEQKYSKYLTQTVFVSDPSH